MTCVPLRPAGWHGSRIVLRQISFDTYQEVLTPHPGPLPVEGRGGQCVSAHCDHAAKSSGVTPSPLNGERAGVRFPRTSPRIAPLNRRETLSLISNDLRIRFMGRGEEAPSCYETSLSRD